MKNKIYPSIWFNNQAKEAAELYCSLFDDSTIHESNAITTSFSLNGYYIMGIDGGPMFQPNPSISLYVECDSEEELDTKYEALVANGKVIIPLGTYPWSEKYAFIQDQFNVCWQLTLRSNPENPQITPALLFVNDKNGMAEEAIDHYASIFHNSQILEMEYYEEGQQNAEGNVLFSRISIDGFQLIAMDGPDKHDYDFNEGFSFLITTKDQAETDEFWEELIGEDGNEGQCGWLKDPFGISWQVVPKTFMDIMANGSEESKKRVLDCIMSMKKLIVKDIEQAAL